MREQLYNEIMKYGEALTTLGFNLTVRPTEYGFEVNIIKKINNCGHQVGIALETSNYSKEVGYVQKLMFEKYGELTKYLLMNEVSN